MNIWARMKGLLKDDEAVNLEFKKKVWARYVLDNLKEDERGNKYVLYPSCYTRSKTEEGMYLSNQELKTLRKAIQGGR